MDDATLEGVNWNPEGGRRSDDEISVMVDDALCSGGRCREDEVVRDDGGRSPWW